MTWLWDWIRAHLTLREWHEWSQGLHRQSRGLRPSRGAWAGQDWHRGEGSAALSGWVASGQAFHHSEPICLQKDGEPFLAKAS